MTTRLVCTSKSRWHFGPICVNGRQPSGRSGPTCQTCGSAVSRDDRDRTQRLWNQVRDMLAPYKTDKRRAR